MNFNFEPLTDIKGNTFTFCSPIYSVQRRGETITFLVQGFYSSNCNYFEYKIYTKKNNNFLNYTYHFSDSFYRNWFTGCFHSSDIFSFFPFNWLKLWYFQYFLCFSSSESYFMVKLRCMDRSVSLRDFDWLISDEGSWSRWVYLMGSSFKTNGSHAES